MSNNTAEVVIVGGGIIGCATAYYLAKLGVTDIVVVEKDFFASGSTGRCGAGVRQQWGLKMNVLLARESIQAYENLNEELDTGMDIEFKQEGYLMLAYNEKTVEQSCKMSPCKSLWELRWTSSLPGSQEIVPYSILKVCWLRLSAPLTGTSIPSLPLIPMLKPPGAWGSNL